MRACEGRGDGRQTGREQVAESQQVREQERGRQRLKMLSWKGVREEGMEGGRGEGRWEITSFDESALKKLTNMSTSGHAPTHECIRRKEFNTLGSDSFDFMACDGWVRPACQSILTLPVFLQFSEDIQTRI